MRFIGHLENQTLAEKLGSLLRVHGIQNLIEADDDRRWSVWIIAEDDTARARELLGALRTDPDHPSFQAPPTLPRPEPAHTSGPTSGPGPAQKPTPPVPTERRRPTPRPSRYEPLQEHLPWITAALILLCAMVGFLTGLGSRPAAYRWLLISEIPYRLGASWALFLPEVRTGQVWRIVSPALLHFGWPHALFNLWAFWDLAGLIERRAGPSRLIGLILGLALVSNLGQYLAAGPNFGGMSGVIYGLLGYAWMMGRYRPQAGIGLHPQTVVLMLAWFVICLTPALGVPVANAAHGFGLISGIFWGRLAARQT